MKTVNEFNIITAEHKFANALVKANSLITKTLETIMELYSKTGRISADMQEYLAENITREMRKTAEACNQAKAVLEAIINNENGDASAEEIAMASDRLDYLKEEVTALKARLQKILDMATA